MKTSIAFLVIAAAMIVLPIRAATPTTQPDCSDYQAMKDEVHVLEELKSNLETENQALKSTLESLRLENRRLLAELEASKLQLGSTFKLAPFSLIPLPQAPDKNAKSFQFNGRIVYVEPIKQGLGTIMIDTTRGMNLIDDRPAQPMPAVSK